MHLDYQGFTIRDWQGCDRISASRVISQVLQEYGLPWQPETADRDVVAVEEYYVQTGGEFWVIEQQGKVVGTAAYYPIERGQKAVEIRKMYCLPEVRGKGLGRFILGQLERVIKARGYREIWVETASVLKEAVRLYEKAGYVPATGVETARCDLIYKKVLK
ncbi:GNAT family N-acetyltransferase [Spirulina sp. CS-785/01]|uniref:GNAT family N-acetyltransferase n=1 Tax=Spirulina sp. CS-785/01 TaxID=3021716 RepID=UPI003FA688D5